MNSQGLCDGQDLVYLLIFSLCEVFFREAVWRGNSQLIQEQCRLLHRALERTETGKLMRTVRNRHGPSSGVMERASGRTKCLCYNQKAMELGEVEAERKDLSARTQWSGGGALINPFYFYSAWHNHSELKTTWLAKLVFEYSQTGWFQRSFWDHFLKRVSFGGASSTVRLTRGSDAQGDLGPL